LSDPADKKLHDRIVQLAGSMLPLQLQFASAESEVQIKTAERQIEATDAEIDRLVHNLYGLTAEEIAIVEESVGLPNA
jgi:hypothetical protein